MQARRRFLHSSAATALSAWLAPAAQAQPQATAWPVKPVRIVVPSAAGSPWDPLARHLAERPGQLIYCSGGNGSPAHLMGESFKQLTGTFILHVPYRGPVAALQDLIGEQSDMMFASLAAALPHIRSGRLRALAVTANERLQVLPDTPTFAQAGYDQFDVRDWAGLVGPASLPASAVERLNAEVVKALAEPGVAARFAQMGVYLHSSSAAAFGDWVRKEIPKWGEVVRRANIRME